MLYSASSSSPSFFHGRQLLEALKPILLRCRLAVAHRSLRVKGGPSTTTAMAAGLTDWALKWADLLDLVDAEYEASTPVDRHPPLAPMPA